MTTLDERYSDLLGADASPERARLIAHLERTLAVTPPPHLAASMDRALARRLAATNTGRAAARSPESGAAASRGGTPRQQGAEPRWLRDDPRRRTWRGRLPSLVLAVLALVGASTVSQLLPRGQQAGTRPAPTVSSLLPPVLTDTYLWKALADPRTGRVFTQSSRGITLLDARGRATLLRPAGAQGTMLNLLGVDSVTGRLYVVLRRPGRSDGLGQLDPLTGRVQQATLALSAPGSPYTGGTPSAVADAGTGRLFVALEGVHQPAAEFHYTGAVAVSMLDQQSGRVLRTLYLGRSPAALAVDERTHHVFLSTVHTVAMLDGRTGALLHTFRPSPSSQDAHLALVTPLSSRLGRVFVINDISGDDPTASHTTVSLLDTRTGRAVATLPGGLGRGGVAVDEARGRAYLADGDQVTVLDARTGQVLRRLTMGGAPSALAVDTRTGHLLVARTGPVDAGGIPRGRGRLSIINPEGGALPTTYTTGYMPWDIVVLPDAGRAFIINAEVTRDGPAPLALPASVTMLSLAR